MSNAQSSVLLYTAYDFRENGVGSAPAVIVFSQPTRKCNDGGGRKWRVRYSEGPAVRLPWVTVQIPKLRHLGTMQ